MTKHTQQGLPLTKEGENMSEPDKMQTEAISRAREMYRRSQSYNAGTFPNGYSGTAGTSSANHTQRQTHSSPQENNTAARTDTQEEKPQTPLTPTNIPSPAPTAAAHTTPPQSMPAPPAQAQNISQESAPAADFLEPLMNDKERTLIILLIALLSGEAADAPIVLALMYLLM